MLSIGEFSNICQVSTKTLRYYAEIGLILPEQVNPENGYRYYSIDQLETMLLINRLKSYSFSLEEIKEILKFNESQDEKLCLQLIEKKQIIEKQVQKLNQNLKQLNSDINNLKQGKSIMTYLEDFEIQLVEVPVMYLLSIRKMVNKNDMAQEYSTCFNQLLMKINNERLTIQAPPMVLFHSNEFTPLGLDIEFAIPIKEHAIGVRDFNPGLCLKTVLHGSYSNLPSIYAKQTKWAENHGYASVDALYEVYVNDPSQVTNEKDLITEIYYPVKKKR